MTNPYETLPEEAFWKTGVANEGIFGIQNLWRSRWRLPRDAKIATYGSCFAQTISRALTARNLGWHNCEVAPQDIPAALAKAYNYGVFSARTGNIYTARQLLMWAQLSVTHPDKFPQPEIWEDHDGFRDSLRPAIEPSGFASLREARDSRAEAVRAFRQSIRDSDVLVYTLGLTEGWENKDTGYPYAMCPGTTAGTFDPDLHVLRHYRFDMLVRQFRSAFEVFQKINPDLKILLTVSPVSPVATQSGQHILTAGMHTKSLLRAVASELTFNTPSIDYFPSYELVASPAARGIFYNQNLRTIAAPGVDFVMGHFFEGLNLSGPLKYGTSAPVAPAPKPAKSAEDLACEELDLEAYAND